MAIESWSEEIHKPQEGEVSREWCYLYPFLYWPGDLKSYHDDFLVPVFDGTPAIDLLPACPNIENFQFDRHDVSKGEPPSYHQLSHWNKGINCNASVKYTWFDRRSSRIRFEMDDAFEVNKLKLTDALPELMDAVLLAAKKAENIMLKEYASGKYTSNKAEANSKANGNYVDTAYKLAGIPNNYTKEDSTQSVSADVTQEVKSELATDLDKVQEEILSPAFAEVTRKLSTHLKDND